MLSWGR